MKQDQKYTPKYQVVHDTTTEDVLLWTAEKSLQGAVDEYNLNMEVSFEEEENLEVVLVSLEMVVL